MMALINSVYFVFPIAGLILLFCGLRSRYKQYISMALWVSLIAVLLEYHRAGGEILGSYFNYKHTLVYSINLTVLLVCIIYLLLNSIRKNTITLWRYLSSFIAAVALTGTAILIANLWINARFIENRYPSTPLLQVSTFNPIDYCNYNYVFYKVNPAGEIQYMCPNYFGLLPSVGKLNTAPLYVVQQLPASLQAKFLDKPLVNKK